MLILRNSAYHIVFYGLSILYVIMAGLLLPFGSRTAIAMAQGWARMHRRCARLLLGIRIRVEGEVPSGQVIVAAKHQAFFETTELILLLDAPITVFKQELLRVPLWGRVALAYGVIPISREKAALALRTMLTSAHTLSRDGRIILIFPEGTRVDPGEAPPIKSGVSGLYAHLGLPVVPLAIDSGHLWPRRSWLKRPGVITFRFGAPIPPGLPRAVLQNRIHAGINALNRSGASGVGRIAPQDADPQR